MTVTASPERDVPVFRRARRFLQVTVAILVVAAIAPLRPLLDQPHFVRAITFHNPSSYDLDIEVTDASGAGWMSVWLAQRNGTTNAREIYDIGDTWVFRFKAQGRTSSALRLPRHQLEADRWHVRIPSDVGDELLRRGAPPPP